PSVSYSPATPYPRSTPFPYTTLFRSERDRLGNLAAQTPYARLEQPGGMAPGLGDQGQVRQVLRPVEQLEVTGELFENPAGLTPEDRKSTRLNSSHVSISYAVFCLKKK